MRKLRENSSKFCIMFLYLPLLWVIICEPVDRLFRKDPWLGSSYGEAHPMIKNAPANALFYNYKEQISWIFFVKYSSIHWYFNIARFFLFLDYLDYVNWAYVKTYIFLNWVRAYFHALSSLWVKLWQTVKFNIHMALSCHMKIKE